MITDNMSTLCLTLHDWSEPFGLCPDHNGTQYEYCRACGVMRLSDKSRKWMNENNPTPEAGR